MRVHLPLRRTLVAAGLSVLVAVAAISGRDALVSRRRVPPPVTISVWVLSVARHDDVITKGAVSGEVAGIRFVPTGRVKTPRTVALTFDDGPSPTYTPQILRLLRRDHVPATFFVIGELAQRYPNLVRAEIRSGMSVGNHSWDHPDRPPFVHLDRITRESARRGQSSAC